MTNEDDAPALDPKHLLVLARLHEAGVRHVEASTNPAYGFPFSTLAAMERRGLVELSYKRQDAIHGDPRPYRIARLTDAGKAAYARVRHAANVAGLSEAGKAAYTRAKQAAAANDDKD